MADRKCSSETKKYKCGNGHVVELLSKKPKPARCPNCGNTEIEEVKECGCGGDCECGKGEKDKKGECQDTFQYSRGGCGSGCGKKNGCHDILENDRDYGEFCGSAGKK